jgi:hypothetical protein
MATGSDAAPYWDGRGLALLWSAVLLGPAALAINIGVGYPLVKWACMGGNPVVLVAVWVGALSMAIVGLALGARLLRQARGAREDGGSVVDRSYFGAKVALGVNGLAILLVLTNGLAQLVVDACE